MMVLTSVTVDVNVCTWTHFVTIIVTHYDEELVGGCLSAMLRIHLDGISQSMQGLESLKKLRLRLRLYKFPLGSSLVI